MLARKTSIAGIGVANENTPRSGMPGWRGRCWALHLDDGRIYDGTAHGRGRDYADQGNNGKDHVTGCFYDLEKSELSFIYDGKMLGKFVLLFSFTELSSHLVHG